MLPPAESSQCGHGEFEADRDATVPSKPVNLHAAAVRTCRGVRSAGGDSPGKVIGFDPWLKPLVLRIDAKNRWFPDGEPVTPDNFPGALRKSLSRRPDWFVYLEADPGLDFGVPARAMDMIQGLYAKVILMVPTAPRITGR